MVVVVVNKRTDLLKFWSTVLYK